MKLHQLVKGFTWERSEATRKPLLFLFQQEEESDGNHFVFCQIHWDFLKHNYKTNNKSPQNPQSSTSQSTAFTKNQKETKYTQTSHTQWWKTSDISLPLRSPGISPRQPVTCRNVTWSRLRQNKHTLVKQKTGFFRETLGTHFCSCRNSLLQLTMCHMWKCQAWASTLQELQW